MRVHLFNAAVAILVAVPAQAAPGAVRLTVEPGVGALAPPQDDQTWGVLGGASLAVGLTDQLWVQVHADHKLFLGHQPPLAATGIGVSLTYNLDLLYVTPYIEAGGGWVRIARRDGVGAKSDNLVPVLGLGLDVRWWGWLLAGIGVRYYPVFETDLLASPAYATIHGRLGVVFEPSPGE